MCRELRREPAWVAAIRLAVLRGRVDVGGVLEEANLGDGHARTVRDVLETMADRDLLEEAPDAGGRAAGARRYHPGPVLLDAAPDPRTALNVSDGGAHRWAKPRS